MTSFVIPTYNKHDLLKGCLDNLIRNTDLTDCEVIIVSNGCTDGTQEYVQSLGGPFKLIHWPKPLGYTKATNIGISLAEGEFVILMNNDLFIADWGKDWWLKNLLAPFENDLMGITGIVTSYRGNRPWVMFALAAIRRSMISEIGLLDERFSPGGGEDTEFCLRAQDKGWLVEGVPKNADASDVQFPVWHLGHGTFKELPDLEEIYARNAKRLKEMYGEEIR